MFLENLHIGSDPPHEVKVFIEAPIGGGPIKCELDKAAGMLVVDRFPYAPMRYAGDYGSSPRAIRIWNPASG